MRARAFSQAIESLRQDGVIVRVPEDKRALRKYASTTAPFRQTDALFVFPAGHRKGLAASKSTIARLIRSTIQEAYRIRGKPIPAGLRHTPLGRVILLVAATYTHGPVSPNEWLGEKDFTPFQSYQSRSAPEESCMPTTVNQRGDSKRMKEKARVRQAMLETLGDGPLPKLECADYKLATAFNGEAGIANEIKPFHCVVKFSSTHILESVRSLAQSGLSEAPVSSLFSSIISKGKNKFNVTERKESSSSQGVN
ncbi:unnamed protein product [Ranitomeya imitator]|uniref:Uncharacterized protein n=1 Tax=Ranitomeya imitator TaxID=111125 RepID=A0ABN9MPU4_9NEOB|nr:unnamed protein product [Ranitomeya imitator]